MPVPLGAGIFGGIYWFSCFLLDSQKLSAQDAERKQTNVEETMKVFIKAILVLLIAVAMLTAVSACGKKQTPKLRIGTNAEHPPFEYKEGESFVGVDMDLARKIAEKLEMEYEIIDMEFETLIPSLAAKKIDLALSAITITEKRKAQVDFSDPYYTANQVIVAKQDSKLTMNKIEDIVKFKVGAQNGTTGQIYMSENFVDKNLMAKDNLKGYPTNIEAITDLLNGNLDYVIIDDSNALGYAKLRPIKIVKTIETNESYGIAMTKGAELNSKINGALRDLISSGEVESIIQTHVK